MGKPTKKEMQKAVARNANISLNYNGLHPISMIKGVDDSFFSIGANTPLLSKFKNQDPFEIAENKKLLRLLQFTNFFISQFNIDFDKIKIRKDKFLKLILENTNLCLYKISDDEYELFPIIPEKYDNLGNIKTFKINSTSEEKHTKNFSTSLNNLVEYKVDESFVIYQYSSSEHSPIFSFLNLNDSVMYWEQKLIENGIKIQSLLNVPMDTNDIDMSSLEKTISTDGPKIVKRNKTNEITPNINTGIELIELRDNHSTYKSMYDQALNELKEAWGIPLNDLKEKKERLITSEMNQQQSLSMSVLDSVKSSLDYFFDEANEKFNLNIKLEYSLSNQEVVE